MPLLALSYATADHRGGRQNNNFGGNGGQSRYNGGGGGSGNGVPVSIPGGVDFSNCIPEDNGLCCVTKESTVTSLEKEPVLECNHKNVEKCHYTYVTRFNPAQEEVCEENFEKKCQITFRQVISLQKDLRIMLDGIILFMLYFVINCKCFYDVGCSKRSCPEMFDSFEKGLRSICRSTNLWPTPIRKQTTTATGGRRRMQNLLRIFLYHSLHREDSWKICRRHSVRKETHRDVWTRLSHGGRRT